MLPNDANSQETPSDEALLAPQRQVGENKNIMGYHVVCTLLLLKMRESAAPKLQSSSDSHLQKWYRLLEPGTYFRENGDSEESKHGHRQRERKQDPVWKSQDY